MLVLTLNTDIIRLLPSSCLIVLRAVSFSQLETSLLCALCEKRKPVLKRGGRGRLVNFVLLLTLLKKIKCFESFGPSMLAHVFRLFGLPPGSCCWQPSLFMAPFGWFQSAGWHNIRVSGTPFLLVSN